MALAPASRFAGDRVLKRRELASGPATISCGPAAPGKDRRPSERGDSPCRQIMDRYLLVMTACVDPRQGEYRLNRADPTVRLEDYKTALRFWLQFPDTRIRNILFIENSKYP